MYSSGEVYLFKDMGIGVHYCTCVAKYSCIVVVKPFFQDMGIGVHSCTCVAKYSCLVLAKYYCLVLVEYSCLILAKLHRGGTVVCTVTVR